MQFNTFKDNDLKEVWALIIEKMNQEGEEVCPNSSSFYKTPDGIECSLRRKNGDLIGICYRENNRKGGYRWTIEKTN
ncbi:hypothetical protein [Prochlorococcus marinus]|nr:hypothetical protein [Prochlorococcus marinus]